MCHHGSGLTPRPAQRRVCTGGSLGEGDRVDVKITQDRWDAVRDALGRVADRFAELISSAPDPTAMATKHWTIADTAAHSVSVAWMYTTMLAADDAPFPVPELTGQVATTTVDTVADLNVVVMGEHYTERDTQVLAVRLNSDVKEILRLTEGQ